MKQLYYVHFSFRIYLAVIFAFGKFPQTPLHSDPYPYVFEANRHRNTCPESQSATGI